MISSITPYTLSPAGDSVAVTSTSCRASVVPAGKVPKDYPPPPAI